MSKFEFTEDERSEVHNMIAYYNRTPDFHMDKLLDRIESIISARPEPTTSEPVQDKTKNKWKLIGHSHQIADTGDYDGHYEITDGKTSLFTKDDDEESLQHIVNALNDLGCEFYVDDWYKFENKQLQSDLTAANERIAQMDAEIQRMKLNTSIA